MPLSKGSSRAVIGQNIREMVHAGHPQKQAIAAAYRSAGKSRSPTGDGAFRFAVGDALASGASISDAIGAGITAAKAAEQSKQGGAFFKGSLRDAAMRGITPARAIRDALMTKAGGRGARPFDQSARQRPAQAVGDAEREAGGEGQGERPTGVSGLLRGFVAPLSGIAEASRKAAFGDFGVKGMRKGVHKPQARQAQPARAHQPVRGTASWWRSQHAPAPHKPKVESVEEYFASRHKPAPKILTTARPEPTRYPRYQSQYHPEQGYPHADKRRASRDDFGGAGEDVQRRIEELLGRQVDLLELEYMQRPGWTLHDAIVFARAPKPKKYTIPKPVIPHPTIVTARSPKAIAKARVQTVKTPSTHSRFQGSRMEV